MCATVARGDAAELDALAHWPGYIALYDMDCGDDLYSVFSMVHTEGLHALEVGLIPYMLEILMDNIPKRHHHDLDTLVKQLLKYPKQHGYNDFPRLLWQDSVTTFTQLTGDLKVGKMFAIVLEGLTLD